jgi:hypothetical protein
MVGVRGQEAYTVSEVTPHQALEMVKRRTGLTKAQ